MAQFKVGGKVVAIENRTLKSNGGETRQIKRGQTFVVSGLFACKAGCLSLDIGFRTEKATDLNCTICGEISKRGNTIWHVRSTSFVPIDETEFQQVTYTKILDEIPVCAQ